MLDLPRRTSTIEVPITEDVVAELATMSDSEFIKLVGQGTFTAALTAGDGDSAGQAILDALPMDRLVAEFDELIRGMTGISVDGEPFNPAAEGHAACVPLPWKISAMTQLFAYHTALPKDVLGNSKAPPARPRKAGRSSSGKSGRGRRSSSKASSGSNGKG